MGRTNGAAGASAQRIYDDSLRAWRAKVGWKLAAIVAPLMTAGAASALAGSGQGDVVGGMLIGSGLTMALYTWDSPPRYIEHWKDGAEGERRTARRLAALEREGWVVVHDLQGRRGNRDHVAIGP